MVEVIFTTFSQEFQCIQRISIVYFEIQHHSHSTIALEVIGLVAAVSNQQHHMLRLLGKTYTFCSRASCNRHDISLIFLHAIERIERYLDARCNLIIGSQYKHTIVGYFHIGSGVYFIRSIMCSIVFSSISFIYGNLHVHSLVGQFRQTERYVCTMYITSHLNHRTILIGRLIHQQPLQFCDIFILRFIHLLTHGHIVLARCKRHATQQQ